MKLYTPPYEMLFLKNKVIPIKESKHETVQPSI